MKLRIQLALFSVTILLLSACTQEKTELNTVKEKASYAIGQQIVSNLVPVAPEIDESSLIQGVKDALAQKSPLIDDQTKAEALKEYNEVLQKAMVERLNAEAVANLEEGQRIDGKEEYHL